MDNWIYDLESGFKELGACKPSGFREWFNDKINNDEEVKKDYNQFLDFWKNWEKEGKSKREIPKNHEVYFLSLIIARSFYQDCVELNYKLKKGNDFALGKAYATTLKNYLENGISLVNFSQSNLKYRYWFEICSALQASYSLFSSIRDLNIFLTKTCSWKLDKDINDKKGIPDFKAIELKNYGLYVRDLEDLCIAYSILNSKNSNDALNLLKECNQIVDDKQSEHKSSPSNEQETQQMLSRYENLKNTSEETFKTMICADSEKFLPLGYDRHLTTVKGIIEEINKIVYKHGKFELNSYDGRVQLINKLFKEKIVKLNLKEIDYHPLTVKIVKRLGIQFDSISENELSWPRITPINDALRSLFLLTIMRSIYETNSYYDELGNSKFFTSAVELIRELNIRLNSVCLREIEYEELGETIKNRTTDIFDWFLVECMNEEYKRGITGVCISGFEPFCEFMEINLE